MSLFTPVGRGGYIHRLPVLSPDDKSVPQWVREKYAGRRCVAWYDGPDLTMGDLVAGGPDKPPHAHPIEPRPTAIFTYIPAEPVAGQEVVFDASLSTPAELIDRYVWQIPIGAEDREGKVIVHSFPAGRHIAYLQIFTVDGRMHNAAAQIDVAQP